MSAGKSFVEDQILARETGVSRRTLNSGSGSTELVPGVLLICIHAPMPAYVAQSQDWLGLSRDSRLRAASEYRNVTPTYGAEAGRRGAQAPSCWSFMVGGELSSCSLKTMGPWPCWDECV